MAQDAKANNVPMMIVGGVATCCVLWYCWSRMGGGSNAVLKGGEEGLSSGYPQDQLCQGSVGPSLDGKNNAANRDSAEAKWAQLDDQFGVSRATAPTSEQAQKAYKGMNDHINHERAKTLFANSAKNSDRRNAPQSLKISQAGLRRQNVINVLKKKFDTLVANGELDANALSQVREVANEVPNQIGKVAGIETDNE